jgi:hypothetical protein
LKHSFGYGKYLMKYKEKNNLWYCGKLLAKQNYVIMHIKANKICKIFIKVNIFSKCVLKIYKHKILWTEWNEFGPCTGLTATAEISTQTNPN